MRVGAGRGSPRPEVSRSIRLARAEGALPPRSGGWTRNGGWRVGERRSSARAKAPGKPASEWRGEGRVRNTSAQRPRRQPSAPSELSGNGERPACSRHWRTGACGACGLVAAARQLRRSGEGKVRVAGQLQPKHTGTAKQASRSASLSDRSRNAGDAEMIPVATSSIQSMGQGCRLGLGVTSQCAPCALGNVPRRCPSGERDAQSLRSVQRGRPFGELGSILCGQSRVQERDPPAFSAGKTGKSLNTYSSIRHRRHWCKGLGVIRLKVFAKV